MAQDPLPARLEAKLEAEYEDDPRGAVFFAIGFLQSSTDSEEMEDALDVLSEYVKEMPY